MSLEALFSTYHSYKRFSKVSLISCCYYKWRNQNLQSRRTADVSVKFEDKFSIKKEIRSCEEKNLPFR